MNESVLTITDDNFEEKVLNASKPVLVDFWAPWCHPCTVMAPIVEEIASKVAKKTLIAKINVDENPKTAEKYDIMSIPAFILFENGKPSKTAVGSMNKKKLADNFRKWL